jgi:hypothetical protein
MKRLVKDKKGAVLAEFVVAIFPLLTIFFVFVQLSMLAVAGLIVKHSAIVGARAAAVYSNVHHNVPDRCKDDGKQKIDDGVRAAVGPWQNRIVTNVTVRDQSSLGDDDGVYDLVTVMVTAQVRCDVPLGRIICGRTGIHQIVETKSMPHQGARYTMAKCGGGHGGGHGGGDHGGGDHGGGDHGGGHEGGHP